MNGQPLFTTGQWLAPVGQGAAALSSTARARGCCCNNWRRKLSGSCCCWRASSSIKLSVTKPLWEWTHGAPVAYRHARVRCGQNPCAGCRWRRVNRWRLRNPEVSFEGARMPSPSLPATGQGGKHKLGHKVILGGGGIRAQTSASLSGVPAGVASHSAGPGHQRWRLNGAGWPGGNSRAGYLLRRLKISFPPAAADGRQ